MRKWYLITTYPERKVMICHSERDDLPKWSSCSPGYETKNELRVGENIQEWKCSKCGGLVELTYKNNHILEQHKMCFTCNHFREVGEIAKVNKNRVIINGRSFHIEPDNNDGGFSGFGGHRFQIKRFDSEKIIVTKNLWHQGDIPEIWREDIPNNAEFIK